MSTHRILLIEDDATEAQLARVTLNKIDPDLLVTRFHNGADFLTYYHEHRPLTDVQLTIMDLHMPIYGGLEVLRVLQEEDDRPGFPIVLFTSSQDESEIASAYQLGGTAFVTKPDDPEAYRDALRNIVNFWVSTNRLR